MIFGAYFFTGGTCCNLSIACGKHWDNVFSFSLCNLSVHMLPNLSPPKMVETSKKANVVTCLLTMSSAMGKNAFRLVQQKKSD